MNKWLFLHIAGMWKTRDYFAPSGGWGLVFGGEWVGQDIALWRYCICIQGFVLPYSNFKFYPIHFFFR